jgi:ABC-type polysaccharide/polyol phosphate export permease
MLAAAPKQGFLSTAGAFCARDFKIAWSYRVPFVPALMGVTASLVTFRFVSRLVQGADALDATTADFFSFVVVGMVAAHVLQRAMTAPPTQVRLEQVQGTLEVLASRPLSPAALALGWTAWPLAEGLTIALGMLGIGVALGVKLNVAGLLVAVPVLVLSGLVFAAIGVAVSALVLVFQRGTSWTRWIVAAMGFVGGVLFPVSLLPRWAQVAAEASPLTHTLRALRGSLLGTAPGGTVLTEVAVLGVFAIIAVPCALLILTAALRRARTSGTIGTY